MGAVFVVEQIHVFPEAQNKGSFFMWPVSDRDIITEPVD